MKPKWLIETGVWKDTNVSRMIQLVRDLDMTVHAEPYSPFSAAEFALADEDCSIVFYGSLNTAEQLRVSHPSWVPFIWFNKDAFSCRTYYGHWGKYLVQEHYGFYPAGDLVRLQAALYRTYGKDDMVFIRPDDNDKSFSGRLVPLDNFARWHEDLQAGNPGPTALVVVATPVRIAGEWRFVIADRKVIAGSLYKGTGESSSASADLRQASCVAEAIARDPWQPRAIYCADIARTSKGDYRLVEIGGINSAGLYHCDLLPVVQAMSQIAVREFLHWKGRS